jgi:predicted nucleic acid-binding protein
LATVVDSSFVIALLRADDEDHPRARDWMETVSEDLVTSPLALAEIGHFAALGGPDALDAYWSDLESGIYTVRWWADALSETIAIARRNPPIGLADASLVAVAAKVSTNRIATFDHRHFRKLTTVGGDPFVVLPADAP